MQQQQQLFDISAEESVLGAIMVRSSVLYELADKLHTDDFYRQSHRVVYSAMLRMQQQRTPIDIVTLTEQLNADGVLDRVGGIPLITQLANTVPSAANALYHARIVLKYAKRRQFIAVAQELQAAALDLGEGLDARIDAVQEKLTRVSLHDDSEVLPMSDSMVRFAGWLNRRLEQGSAGVMSGISPLDRITHGWQAGALYVLAARPSMGKTALSLNFAAAAAKSGKRTAVFSLEMSREQIEARLIAAESGVGADKILNPALLLEKDWEQVILAEDAIGRWPMFIVDSGVDTVTALAAKCRQIRGRYGLDLVVIDYLQLLGGDSFKPENRQQEIAGISRRLKLLAKELNVPIVVLSQLSRAVESRQDKRPIMSDLRESGAIEQDADMVMFLYREDYYHPERAGGVTELSVKKNRNGAVGRVGLRFIPALTKFVAAPLQLSGTAIRDKDVPM